ncbi:IS3 family transposase [Ruminiclostridium cellobioparum]|uniref:IS3 family transposase n=1 Tax=Ruminiclostridium cellobioparum TaxID=29355 RepID=UPI0028AA8625|nr:IS3 family transposase [Ruminiclostridium cellobioparum]
MSYPITELCDIAGIQRSSYYKWLNRKESNNEQFNKNLLPLIKDAYEEKNGILGYRQMTIKLNRENDFHVNDKRIYRLMRILNLKSVCCKKKKNYIRSTPEITAENVLNREFHADEFRSKLGGITITDYKINIMPGNIKLRFRGPFRRYIFGFNFGKNRY